MKILSAPIKIPISRFLEETSTLQSAGQQEPEQEVNLANAGESTTPLAAWMENSPQRAPVAPAVTSQPEVGPSLGADHEENQFQVGHADQAEVSNQQAPLAERRDPPLPRPVTLEQMQAAAHQALELMERGKRLAEKRAYHSSQSEFRGALNVIADALDSSDGGQRRQALKDALVAFEEAREFHAMSKRKRQVTVSHLVLTHETSVLQRVDCTDVRLRTAMEMYFEYAQRRLVDAMQDAPMGAEAYFLLGKLHKSAADLRAGETLDGPKAMAFHQAAVTLQPRHHHAANELGVILAKHGQWKTAKQLLLQSVQANPTVEAWTNLAQVHSQLGEHPMAQLATAEAQLMTRQRYSASPSRASRDLNQVVTWVSPQDFSRMVPANSPQPQGPSVAPPLANGAVQPQPQRCPVSTVSTPTRVSPWRQPRSN